MLKKLLVACVLVLAVTIAEKAEASDFSLRFFFHKERRHRDGYFENRWEKVLICPERVKRIWYPALYREVYSSCGKVERVCISEGYYEEVLIPAVYEWRKSRVWISR